jgi:hypothetical protein
VAIKKKIKFMTGINYLAVVVATAAAFLFRKADRGWSHLLHCGISILPMSA